MIDVNITEISVLAGYREDIRQLTDESIVKLKKEIVRRIDATESDRRLKPERRENQLKKYHSMLHALEKEHQRRTECEKQRLALRRWRLSTSSNVIPLPDR